jgi:hypothetical protein
MPQYDYAAPTSSYAGTIARLLAQRGDPAAQAALRIAEAQARAAEQRGTAWAGAVQTIGQIPAQVQQQQQQQKTQALDTEAKTLAVSSAKRAESARTVLSDVMSATPKLSEDGVSVWDVPAITRAMAEKGFGPEAGAAAQHLDSINDAFRKTRAAQLAVVQRGAQAVAAAGNDPILASHFLDQVEANQIYPKARIEEYRAFIQADPANVGKLTAYLMGPQKMENAAAGSMARSPVTGQVVPGSEVPERAGTGDYTINGQRFTAKGYPLGPAVAPQVAPAAAQTHNMRLKGVGDVPVDYVPNKDGSGGKWMYQGKDVTGDVTAIPAASITIHNQQEATNAPNRTSMAEGLNDGTVVPSMLSKRSADYNAIFAEANRIHIKNTGKPLNFAKLELDYKGAQRFVASLNGPNMVRFQALGKSVVNTIDEVRALGDELQQGGIQKWNSVTRSTIQKVYGNTPQSDLAARYVSAVNTLKEEYANLANGGYAPTEPAWKLANEQINGDYGFKDLHAALLESQRLINFRLQGFLDLTPITIGGGGDVQTTDPLGIR